jgi:hypothetical protein
VGVATGDTSTVRGDAALDEELLDDELLEKELLEEELLDGEMLVAFTKDGAPRIPNSVQDMSN